MAQVELRALVEKSKDGDDWEAICLEMDIVANGCSSIEAISNLISLIKTQFEFAKQNGHLESVWFPAPRQYWAKFFEEGKNANMVHLSEIQGDPQAELEYRELVCA